MFSLIQEDWNVAVRQIEEFDPSVDGIYLANDVKEVQHLVARSSDSSKNICFVPFLFSKEPVRFAFVLVLRMIFSLALQGQADGSCPHLDY